jgi:hypothetical protein
MQTAGRSTAKRHNSLRSCTLALSLVIACVGTCLAAKAPGGTDARARELALKLQDEDATVRLEAAWQLRAMRSDAEAAIDSLAKLLNDEDHGVRRAAVAALFAIGPAAMEKQPWMKKKGMEPITPDAAREAFEKLWETVDREYAMFVIRPDVDWATLREQYRPKALTAQSDTELGLILSDMLAHLRDHHVWLKVRGHNLPVYSHGYPNNWNRNHTIYEELVGPLNGIGQRVFWAKTPDKIGWVVVLNWSDADIVDRFDAVLEEMRDTRGLIVDVRSNGGGDSMLACLTAARFADRPRTYMHYQYRTGRKHTDLTEKIARKVVPRGPWRYDRPVVLLQGRKCVSANESFCAQMAVCPNITTIGEPTKGSTGSPIWFPVGADIEVAVPQWIAYLPNGELFDEKGVAPKVLFEYRPDAFEGNKDELLSAALAKLRKEPLPATPIAGPSIREFRARRAAEEAHIPKVVSVEPKAGSTNVDPRTALRIRFDRPMRCSTVSLQWESGGVHRCDRIRYDKGANEFTLPVTLEPSRTHRIVVNPRGPVGFKSIHGTPAGRYEWAFTTGGSSNRGADEKARSAAALPVQGIVEEFNQMRAAMRSFVETVDTVECSEPGPDGFRRLRAYSAVFNMQGPEEYFADVSDVCGRPTVLFATGALNHVCGYYRHDGSEPSAVASRSEEISRSDIKLADPFESCAADTDAVCEQLKLKYGGTVDLEGRRCHVVESYTGSEPGRDKPARRWWIDAESHLLVRVVSHDEKAGRNVSWLSFDGINEPQAQLESFPNVPYQVLYKHRKMAEPLKNGSTGRFMQINDGCRGSICARWGQYGPDGEEYVGL